MSVQSRKRKRGTVHYAVFSWKGKRVWELVGKDRREADRVDRQRHREVAAGTYVPGSQRSATSFGQWIMCWLDNRGGRSADDERRWIEMYVLPMEWLAKLPLEDLTPAHMLRLVENLKKTVGKHTGKKLAAKSVANIYGVVRTCLRDARIARLIPIDPCVLPPKTITRGVTTRRHPYPVEQARALMLDERALPDARVWNAIAFYTAMREGEVCGRRWRDYDRKPRPLGCLSVETQYDDQPLKTDQDGDWHPRRVPVHPELARILDWWWSEGFALVHCRPPTLDDFIVPSRELSNHTKSSAYKMWRRACAKVGVTNLSLHSTRHTFITEARRGGADKDVLEKITHNAKGTIVDVYTHWDWTPLCEVVLCLNYHPVDAEVDDDEDTLENKWRRRESNSGHSASRRKVTRGYEISGEAEDPPKHAESQRPDADRGARQRGEPGDDVLRVPAAVQRFVAPLVLEAKAKFLGGAGEADVLKPLRKAAKAIDRGRVPRSAGGAR